MTLVSAGEVRNHPRLNVKVGSYSHFLLATGFPVTEIMLRIWFISVDAMAIEIMLPLSAPLFRPAFGKIVITMFTGLCQLVEMISCRGVMIPRGLLGGLLIGGVVPQTGG